MPSFIKSKNIWIAQLMSECGLSASNSESLRLIKQGAVKLNHQKLEDCKLNLQEGEYVLQVGKRKFIKVLIQ